MAHPPGRLIYRPYKPNAAPERTTRTDQASEAVCGGRPGAAVAPDRPAPFWAPARPAAAREGPPVWRRSAEPAPLRGRSRAGGASVQDGRGSTGSAHGARRHSGKAARACPRRVQRGLPSAQGPRRWAGGPRRLRSATQRRQDVGEGAANAVERARDLWGHRRDRVRPEPSTPTGPPRGCCRISPTTSPAGGPRPNVTPVSSSATRAPTCPAGGSRPNATVPGRRQRRISASRTRAPVHRPSRSPARPDHDRPGRSPTPAARGTTKKEARWCRKERMCAWEIRSAACSARS